MFQLGCSRDEHLATWLLVLIILRFHSRASSHSHKNTVVRHHFAAVLFIVDPLPSYLQQILLQSCSGLQMLLFAY